MDNPNFYLSSKDRIDCLSSRDLGEHRADRGRSESAVHHAYHEVRVPGPSPIVDPCPTSVYACCRNRPPRKKAMKAAIFVDHLVVGVVGYQILFRIFYCSNPSLDVCRKNLKAALKKLTWAGDILRKNCWKWTVVSGYAAMFCLMRLLGYLH